MMTNEQKSYRAERIERLWEELKYEVTRGMMECEIDERIGLRFIVPISHNLHNGVVSCEFCTRPVPREHVWDFEPSSTLRIAPSPPKGQNDEA